MRSGKEPPKRIRENNPWRSHRTGNRPHSHQTRVEDLIIHGALSRALTRALFQLWSLRLKAVLVLPNKAQKQVLKGSNYFQVTYDAQNNTQEYFLNIEQGKIQPREI